MKRFISLLTVLLALVCVFAACEDEEQPEIDHTAYLSFTLMDDDTYSVSLKRDVEVTEIVIPDTYEGKPVTKIVKKGFLSGSKLQKVTIPPSITSIDSEAFKNCKELSGVYIIDLAAWCNIDFEDPSANPLYVAGKLYLNGQSVIDVIKIPTTVSTIKPYAFTNCVFHFLEIPENVTSIGDGAFYGCRWMLSPNLPASLESIGAEAFAFCESIISVTFAPESRLKSIGDGAFKECDLLRYFTIPQGTTSIGVEAFDRTALSEVSLPESVLYIGERAFNGCDSLTSVSIPSSVEYIGYLAFGGCDKLNYTVSNGGKYLGNDQNPYILLCHVDTACVDFSISDKTVFIEGNAFEACTELSRITIPAAVLKIGEYAFKNCSKLVEVSFAENAKLKKIGNFAFYSCEALTTLNIPASVTSIGCNVFIFCDQVAKVTFDVPDGWWYSPNSEATSGTPLSVQALSAPIVAATYLKTNYCSFYWERTVE